MNARHLPVGTKIWTSSRQKEPQVVTGSTEQEWGVNLEGGISVDFPYTKYQTTGRNIYAHEIYAYELPSDKDDEEEWEDEEPEERTGVMRWLFGK